MRCNGVEGLVGVESKAQLSSHREVERERESKGCMCGGGSLWRRERQRQRHRRQNWCFMTPRERKDS